MFRCPPVSECQHHVEMEELNPAAATVRGCAKNINVGGSHSQPGILNPMEPVVERIQLSRAVTVWKSFLLALLLACTA